MGTDRIALNVRGLRVERGGAPVLRGVDLTVARGEVVALLGPSGAGKSTLVHAIAGLLPVGGGEVRVDGRVAAALQGAALARRSVRANLDAALGWWGTPRAERPARIESALERCAAGHLADRAAGSLSGGEATRVHLARAVALSPDVLLLDEPFAGLDPVVRGELLAEAGGFIRDPARATVVVVHDRAEAWALADRIAVLLDGVIAADGPPHAVLDAPPSEAVAEFLGFVGCLRDGDGSAVVRLRPSQVRLVTVGAGAVDGIVRALVPEPDGVVVRVIVDARGEVAVRAPLPGPSVGERVGLELVGGARFVRGDGDGRGVLGRGDGDGRGVPGRGDVPGRAGGAAS